MLFRLNFHIPSIHNQTLLFSTYITHIQHNIFNTHMYTTHCDIYTTHQTHTLD